MQKNIKNIENNKEILDEAKVKEYMSKYIKELQRHFDLSDRKMRVILYRVYKESSPFSFIKVFLKNQISMLKSKSYKK